MSIECRCDNCNKRYRLKDHYAGKTVRCPNCREPVQVPAAEEPAPMPVVEPEPPQRKPPRTRKPPKRREVARQWYVTMEDETQYGPVDKEELDSWVADGSVTAECQVLRDGDPEWQWAGDVYPELAAEPVAPGVDTGGGFVDTGPRQRLLSLARKQSGWMNKLTNKNVEKEARKAGAGTRVTRSERYDVGEPRSFWEKLRAHSVTGLPMPGNFPITPAFRLGETHVDQLHVFSFAAPSGEFHAAMPFDAGRVLPHEFFSIQPGSLPSAIVLNRGSMGSWGSGEWTNAEGFVDNPVAEAANSRKELQEGIKWNMTRAEGGGPDSTTITTFKLEWAVQAIPLGTEEYLLVVQSPMRRKLVFMNLGVEWYLGYRRAFSDFLAGLRCDGEYRSGIMHSAHAFVVLDEVVGVKLFG